MLPEMLSFGDPKGQIWNRVCWSADSGCHSNCWKAILWFVPEKTGLKTSIKPEYGPLYSAINNPTGLLFGDDLS